jgi:hypothetical protein
VQRRRAATNAEHAEYAQLADTFQEAALELLERTDDLRQIDGDALKLRRVLDIARYAAVPMISHDDLDNLTGARFKNWIKQKEGGRGACPTDEEFEEAAAVLTPTIDPLRAPWLAAGRAPTKREREQFAFATALGPAQNALTTSRRKRSSGDQEEAIRAACAAADYQPASPPSQLTDPLNEMDPGTFATAARSLRRTSMDVPVRLAAGHHLKLLAIEAKVSNTAINSRKRLMEVMNKRAVWDGAANLYAFRTAAVLAGDFAVERLKEAQDAGVIIFWEHRLDDLTNYLKL